MCSFVVKSFAQLEERLFEEQMMASKCWNCADLLFVGILNENFDLIKTVSFDEKQSILNLI